MKEISANSIEKITAMERLMNRVAAALCDPAPLSDSVRDDIKALDYYYHTDWLSDFEADENGLLPEDLKRGVLSEDALYDLLSEADKRK